MRQDNQDNSVNVSVSPQEQQLLLWVKNEVDLGVESLQQGQPEVAIARFIGALEKTPPHLSAYDVVTHNLMTAYKASIDALLQLGDTDAVNRHLRAVFALQLRGQMAQDAGFRGRFADAYYDLGKVFYRARQNEAALACVRRAIAIQPCPSYYVDLTNALGFVKSPARLEDYTRAYKPQQLGLHLFIACAPKSGSTFLKNVLVRLTRFKDLFTVYAALQNEHELDLPQMVKFGTVNTVTQQHCRATEANIQLMQAFGIKPVILVRNIFDTVVSLLDFYKGGFTFSTFLEREDFDRLTDEERIDFLIEYAVPWYFQFVASWQRAEREGRLVVHWITYEEMLTDKAGAIGRLLAFHGMSLQREDIERSVADLESNERENRFNKGIAGRGQAGLTSSQRERITRLGRYYGKTDFGCLGL